MLLDGPAFTWYSIQGNVTGWSALRAALLGYFKPAGYTYKPCQALAKCSQHGTVTEYIEAVHTAINAMCNHDA